MSTAKKSPAHHAPVRSHHAAPAFEQKPHAERVEASIPDVPAEETAAPVVVPPAVEPMAEPPVDAAPAIVEPEASSELTTMPAETTIADHFDCACGPARNLSMEAGVYRCHGCGTTHHAQTLEGRKAASK